MTGERVFVSAITMSLVIAIGSFASLAQEPSAKKSTEKTEKVEKPAVPVAKKKADPSRRVPDYFGQIGLTPEQRESIYKLRKKHQESIDGLKKQISETEAKSLGECEAVLNDTQKKLLENLRTNGARPTQKSTTAK